MNVINYSEEQRYLKKNIEMEQRKTISGGGSVTSRKSLKLQGMHAQILG